MALLEIRNMTHFFGGLRAVYDFNLRLEGGELMGLIGPNGAGKTTVFNLVCGFYRPTEGEILFEGKEIAGLRPHAVTAMGIARTFQNIRLWNTLPVYDNLCISQHFRLGYGLKDALLRTRRFAAREKNVHKTAEELLELLGCATTPKSFPETSLRVAAPPGNRPGPGHPAQAHPAGRRCWGASTRGKWARLWISSGPFGTGSA